MDSHEARVGDILVKLQPAAVSNNTAADVRKLCRDIPHNSAAA